MRLRDSLSITWKNIDDRTDHNIWIHRVKYSRFKWAFSGRVNVLTYVTETLGALAHAGDLSGALSLLRGTGGGALGLLGSALLGGQLGRGGRLGLRSSSGGGGLSTLGTLALLLLLLVAVGLTVLAGGELDVLAGGGRGAKAGFTEAALVVVSEGVLVAETLGATMAK